MNIVVFSKDRACQLDLFLRGFLKQTDISKYGITVIYTYSDSEFLQGYDIIEKPKKVRFVLESNFKQNVLDSVDKNKDLTVFFTDDDIWVNDFFFNNPNFLNFYRRKSEFACFSLRLNPVLNYCYAYSKSIPETERPIFDKFNTFRFKGFQNDYGYPMSLDGHIFYTSDILPLLKSLSYKNPNTLEAEMSKFPISKPFMGCMDSSIIVNNPCNRVQSEFLNRTEGLDYYNINKQFLSGKRLSDKNIWQKEIKAVHQNFDLIYV